MAEMNAEEGLSSSQIEQLREQKIKDYRAQGINTYPAYFDRKNTIAEVLNKYFATDGEVPADSNVVIGGRVMGKRNMGKASFLTLTDFSGKMQVYGNNKNITDEQQFEIFSKIDIGDIIGVEGECFRTQTGESSLRARKVQLLSKNISPLPVVKEKDDQVFDAFADVETRYRKRYLDLVVNESVRNDFVLRSQIVAEIRSFLQKRGFLEVETPMMQAIASGAAARPFATHHNALDMPLFLRIAPELYLKRLIVGGFEKVFELNRNFRNEGISTKHNPEFTMMEIYQAYADYEDMLRLTENLFVHLADTLLKKRTMPFGDHVIDVTPPWPRKGYLALIQEKSGADFASLVASNQITIDAAKAEASRAGLKTDLRHCHTFWEVVDEIFSEKVEPTLIQPIFVVDFPKAISPLAKEHRDDPQLAERFEPYIAAREMGNAFSELNDPFEQKLRFEEQLSQKAAGAAETMELDEDFIEALKVGMPPTGGLGIGIDRLVMLFSGKTSIKDVILFPLLRKK